MSEAQIKPQVSPKYKLERNTVIYSRWLAGETLGRLARVYDLDKSVIFRLVYLYKSKIASGALPPVKPYEE